MRFGVPYSTTFGAYHWGMGTIYSAVPLNGGMANVLFREVPENDEEDEDGETDKDEEDDADDAENEEGDEEGDGYSEGCPPASENIRSTQADLFEGKRNSITLPLCCEGSHFATFENFIGT